MYVTVITPPEPVVTLDEAKLHLRVTSDDENTLIQALIDAATQSIDGPGGWLGRAIGVQTLEARFDRFSIDPIRLPYPPIISITSVKYLDSSEVEQTIAADEYALLSDGRLARSYGSAWPSTLYHSEAVRVRYQAGYGHLEGEGEAATWVNDTPATVKAAILLMVAFLYSNRMATTDQALQSGAVAALLSPLRIWSI